MVTSVPNEPAACAVATIDALVIGLIDAAILYLTLRLCDLQLIEIAIIPPLPFMTPVTRCCRPAGSFPAESTRRTRAARWSF